jgi:HEAT repeat protein
VIRLRPLSRWCMRQISGVRTIVPVQFSVGLILVLTAGAGAGLFATKNPVESAWGILEAGASERNVEKRSDATQALGLLVHDRRARVMAERALDDNIAEVRASAATALSDMLSEASIPKLHEALSDRDPVVVLAAAHALLSLKDDRAYDVYYAVLTGQRKMGEGLLADERKMLQDPKKLAELGVEAGLGAFVPFAGIGLTAWKKLTKDDSSNARAAAARVLAKDPDPQSESALLDALSDHNWIVRVAALQSLAKRGNPAVLKQIEPTMNDEKDAVQYMAAAAVIRLNQLRRGPVRKSSIAK